MKKAWWLGGVVGGVVLAFAVGYMSWRGTADHTVHTSGVIEGVEVEITSKVPGRIARLCCQEGETVKAGEVVVQLEDDDLKAAVAQATAEVVSAKADILRAQAQEEEARRNRDRYTELYGKNAVAKATYDTAITAYVTAVATTGAAEARLAAAQANQRYAEAKWADTIIRSPLDAMVAFRALEEGETVAPGVTMLTLVDQRHLYVRADIDESQIGRIAVGDAAAITVESLPGQVFLGTVAEISRYGDFATQRDVVRGRQDLRTFKVRINLDEDEHGGRLTPGMTVEVTAPVRGGHGR